MQFSKAIAGVFFGGVLAATAGAQDLFSVTGVTIPAALVKVNYGKIPNGIQAFDLNICNETAEKHAVTASQIYQALAKADARLQPLGRQIMLAELLRNQTHSTGAILAIALNSTVSVLSVLGAARTGVPANVLAGAAVGSAVGEQLLKTLQPVLSADQVERYESQVLESALALDGGSCAERTVFALTPPGAKGKIQNLTFHIR